MCRHVPLWNEFSANILLRGDDACLPGLSPPSELPVIILFNLKRSNQNYQRLISHMKSWKIPTFYGIKTVDFIYTNIF